MIPTTTPIILLENTKVKASYMYKRIIRTLDIPIERKTTISLLYSYLIYKIKL